MKQRMFVNLYERNDGTWSCVGRVGKLERGTPSHGLVGTNPRELLAKMLDKLEGLREKRE